MTQKPKTLIVVAAVLITFGLIFAIETVFPDTADGEKSAKQVANKADIVANYRQKDWNRMEIVAKGNSLTQKINGIVFAKVTDDDRQMSRRKGVIALQDHGKGCKVAFRNIRIKELKD